MSHSVTIRTQTVTTSSSRSAIFINSGYLKTWSGILKTLQLLLGIVCVGLMGHLYNARTYYYKTTAELFFLLMVTTFMIGTCILLISYLASITSESIIGKTIYELLYHAIAFGLILAASSTLLVHISNYDHRSSQYELSMGAAICGLVNAVLYLLSAIFALRRYRGL